MCVMLPLSFGALPSLAAPAEDSTDAVKTATKCAWGGEVISQMLCRLALQGGLKYMELAAASLLPAAELQVSLQAEAIGTDMVF